MNQTCFRYFLKNIWLAILLPSISIPDTNAQDFEVSTPIYDYNFTGFGDTANPTITLYRGRTYIFSISAPSHPFRIANFNEFGNPYGTSPQGVLYDPPEPFEAAGISSGIVTYTVGMNDTNNGYYCTVHGFYGLILIEDLPTIIEILGLEVSTNIVLKAIGTGTNMMLIPEYSSDLSLTNWNALTVETNRLDNGTNEVICGKPPGDNVFIRLRTQQLN
jgi:hypothetical protein